MKTSEIIWYCLAGITVFYLAIYIAGIWVAEEGCGEIKKLLVWLDGHTTKLAKKFAGVERWEI
jgi:hypothetical protein